MFKDGRKPRQALGVKLQLVEVTTPDPDLEGAFRVMAKERVGALIAGSGTLGSSLHRRKDFGTTWNRARIPAIYPIEPWIDGWWPYVLRGEHP